MITIERTKFTEALQLCSQVAGAKATLPILGAALVESDQGNLRFRATDLETTICLTVPAMTNGKREFGLPIKDVLNAVRSMEPHEKDVSLDFEEKTVHMNDATFQVFPADEFPMLPTIENPAAFTMSGLGKHLRRSMKATQGGAAGYVLEGIHWNTEANEIVATDGHRLHLIKNAARIEVKPFTILRKTADLIKYWDEEITLTIGENMVSFCSHEDDLMVYSRLIDGKFPNYHDVIPTKFLSSFTVQKELFRAALRESLPFGHEFAAVKMKLPYRSDKLTIEINNPDVGSNQINHLAITDHKGPGTELTLAFNAKFLLDALDALEGASVTLQITDETGPMCIEESDFMALVMPMRL